MTVDSTRTRPARRPPTIAARVVALMCLLACALIGLPGLASAAAPVVTSNAAAVGMAAAPGTAGYWIVAADGGVFSFGGAPSYGSMGGKPINAPVVGMAATPTGHGYWLVGRDGGIYSFGDAGFYGSMGGKPMNAPVVGMAATPSGGGYWLVGADGGIFSFGNAGFFGSAGSVQLQQPVVGMAATPSGNGYWLTAGDGGVFSYGDAPFKGSASSVALNSPVIGIARTASGAGYWLVASDGGVFSYGDAVFRGSMGGQPLQGGMVGMAVTTSGNGYWLIASDGGLFTYGDAPFQGRISYTPPPPSNGGGDTRSKIVAVARSQVGIHETGINCNPYGPCEEWCALFATWTWNQAGIGIPRYGYTGDIYDKWGKANGKSVAGRSGIQPGDVVLYNYGDGGLPSDHVDVVVAVNGSTLTVIGGNVHDAVTQYTTSTSNTQIYGYVRPV